METLNELASQNPHVLTAPEILTFGALFATALIATFCIVKSIQLIANKFS